MQIHPGGGVGGVVFRGGGLSQAGHNAHGHVVGAALAVQDGLVLGQADGLGQHLHDPAGQIDVVVLQDRVAHGHKAGDLVAVQGNLVEYEGQLVNGTAHLGPYGLGGGARDGLPGLAGHVAHPHPVHQLGIPELVFRDQVQEHHRDVQLRAGYRPALALHAPQLGQEVFHVLLLHNGLPPLHGQGVKCPLVHGQSPNVDFLHASLSSHIRFFLGIFGGRGRGLVPLQLLQLVFQTGNVRGQGLFGLVVLRLFGLVGLDFGVDGRLLLGVSGLHLGNGRFQFRLPGLKPGVLLQQCGQFRLFAVDLPFQHQCFQHGVLSFRC